jgi:DDE superfamily endonuclease
VTMRSMARWAGKGGRDRTSQRFCSTSSRGATLPWVLIRPHRLEPEEVILRGGDDVVVTTAGQPTHGWDRVFSARGGKMVRGLGVLRVSRSRGKRRTAYPVMLAQLDRPPTNTPQEVSKHRSHGQRGRPHGSKNQHRRDGTGSPYRRFVHATIKPGLPLIGAHIQVLDLVCDGAFGHQEARHMVRPRGVPWLSKRRDDAALYCPYDGPSAG